MRTSQSVSGINFQAPSPQVQISLQSPSLAFLLCCLTLPTSFLCFLVSSAPKSGFSLGKPEIKQSSNDIKYFKKNKVEGFGEKEDSKPFSHITWEKFEKVLMLVGYSEKEKVM